MIKIEFSEDVLIFEQGDMPWMEEDFANFLIDMYESSIGYWAYADKEQQPNLWVNKPEGATNSEFFAFSILRGEKVKFADAEGDDDSTEWFLHRDKIVEAIQKQTRFNSETYDSNDCDYIAQMAMFGDVIYG